MAEQKQNIDPKLQAWVAAVYAPTIQSQTWQEFNKKFAANYRFDKNVDWISSSYHLERATLIQKKGSKEALEYIAELMKEYQCCGVSQQIKKMQLNGLTGTATVVFSFLDKDGNAPGGETFTEVEERFELNEKGDCVRFISTSPDLDIVSLTKKQYLFKLMKENAAKTKVTVMCLDDDFNVVSFEMDAKADADKIAQIEAIVKEGEAKKKDVNVVVV